ncbi:MAG: KOW domain-containing RNA-binding protein [Clostridia bacterium]|nr:KOW domain-containing RNA-binding protein [Clostridia bacterium]
MKSELRRNRYNSGIQFDSDDGIKRQPNKVTGTMIGRIVQSVAGRDADRYFVIVAEIDGENVAIADGRLRKCVNPKKKKLKHLKLISFAGMECVEKIADGSCSDSYLRRVIAAFRGDADDQPQKKSSQERRDSSVKG